MNFLAHLYLSGNSNEIMVGNFIGDFVKGKDADLYSKHIKSGIYMHRAIDHYTDTHAIVKESKLRLRLKYRHYSGVIVDMFYDHFLAANWEAYADMPLKTFTSRTYEVLKQYKLPPKAAYMLPYMANDDWLYHYQFISGLQQALTGMARRTTFNSQMEYATEDLQDHYEAFQDEFSRFFPELINFSKTFLEVNLGRYLS